MPTPPLVYWGKYVAHDNNRDQIGMALALSQNAMKTYYRLPPAGHARPARVGAVPLHLHRHRAVQPRARSADDRRVASHGLPRGGRADAPRPARRLAARLLGRLGAELHVLARRGTQHHRAASTRRSAIAGRRPRSASCAARASARGTARIPPLPEVRWSLRNNINYPAVGRCCFALHDMAENRERFLERFWTMGKRAIAKAANEGPAAWVLRRRAETAGTAARAADAAAAPRHRDPRRGRSVLDDDELAAGEAPGEETERRRRTKRTKEPKKPSR